VNQTDQLNRKQQATEGKVMTSTTAEKRPKAGPKTLRVIKAHHHADKANENASEHIIDEFDATQLVGLHTIVSDAAIERIDEAGEHSIELPKLNELIASAAILRCLVPIRLRGSEMKAMRKAMRMTLADLARKLDARTAPETVSRWEAEAQPMGAYVEKLLRLLVCETLKESAPGIEYSASMIVNMTVQDPSADEPNYTVPAVRLVYTKIKQQAGPVIDAWAA
jgi:DNA-binding transcriptional regulator YiaG